jgi:hypothetical protein
LRTATGTWNAAIKQIILPEKQFAAAESVASTRGDCIEELCVIGKVPVMPLVVVIASVMMTVIVAG